jgi:hypothetical protein
MLKSLKYGIVAGLFACAAPAAAGDLPPEVLDNVMTVCRADYHRVCSYVVPGGGRVGRCLLDHETELAPPCLKAVKIAYAMEVCLPDYRRFCNGVQPGGGQIAECLAERMDLLAPECQRVVAANAPYAAPGYDRQGPGYDRYSDNRGPGSEPGAYSYRAEPRRPDHPYAEEGESRRFQPYGDRYADHGYDRYSEPHYADGRYPDRGYSRPYYPAPGQSYGPPEEEREPLK